MPRAIDGEALLPSTQQPSHSSPPLSIRHRHRRRAFTAAAWALVVTSAAVARQLAGRAQAHALGTAGVDQPAASAHPAFAAALRALLLAPLLGALWMRERRGRAGVNAAQSGSDSGGYGDGGYRRRVPFVAVACLALLDWLGGTGWVAHQRQRYHSSATTAPASAGALAALAGAWVALPLTLLAGTLLLRPVRGTCTRMHWGVALLVGVGVTTAVAPTLHAETLVSRAGALVASVWTAIPMVGLPLALGATMRDGLLASRQDTPASALWRPSATSIVRFTCSLVVWEALASCVIHAALIPATFASSAGSWPSLLPQLGNSTRCMLGWQSQADGGGGEGEGEEGWHCRRQAWVLLGLVVAEGVERLAALALIHAEGGGVLVLVGALSWPIARLLSSWPAMGPPEQPLAWWPWCVDGGRRHCAPDGTLAVLGCLVVLLALGLYLLVVLPRSMQALPDSSSSSSSSTPSRRPSANPSDSFEWAPVVHEVLGLTKGGVYCLVAELLLLVAAVLFCVIGSIEAVVRGIACLASTSGSSCSSHGQGVALLIAGLCPALALGTCCVACRVRSSRQRHRQGHNHGQGGSSAEGAAAPPSQEKVTLHVYDWSGAQVPLITK
jgi:hypothetical protein